MTMPFTTSKAVFHGNGQTTQFPFSFRVWDKTQLDVQLVDSKGVTRPAQGWSVELTPTGGVITYAPASGPLPPGWSLVALRNMSFVQSVDLISGTRFDPQVIEDALDKATAERQQLREAVERSVKVPPASENPPELLANILLEARDQTLEHSAAAAGSARDAAASAAVARDALEGTIAAHDDALAGINDAREGALSDISSSRSNALTDMTSLRTGALTEVAAARDNAVFQVTHTGQIQVENVRAAGANLVHVAEHAQESLVHTGAEMETRVRNVAASAALEVVLEGDHQVHRVESTGNAMLLNMASESVRAGQEADRAKAAADKAVAVTEIDFASKQRAGIVKVGSGIDVTEDGIISVALPSLLSLPVLSFPAVTAVGYPAVLSMSSSTAIPDASIQRFSVVFDDEPAVSLSAVDGAATLTVTPQGELHGQTGVITVTAYDTNGNASNDAVVTFIKNIVTLDAPRVLDPANGSEGVPLRPSIRVQTARITGMPATPQHTHIQAASGPAFADGDICYDSGIIPYTESHAVGEDLPDGTMVHLRVRHEFSTYGWTAWGTPSTVSIIPKAVLRPQILSPPGDAQDQSVTVAVVASPLATTGVAPQGTHTQVQIARDDSFEQVVFDAGEDAPYGVSVPTAVLPVNTRLYARVRHCDLQLGWSPWSRTTSFTTLNAYANPPTVTAPVEGATAVALKPAVMVSAFSNVGPVDMGKTTHIQIADDVDFANIVAQYSGTYTTSFTPVSDLAMDTAHYVRARHEGAAWGWSLWSDAVSFTTLIAYVNVPSVTVPVSGATDVALRPTVTVSAFSNAGPEDTGKNSHIQIATDATFTNIVAQHNGAYTTSLTPGVNLAINTKYYARARHEGTTWGWSPWSETTVFTTLNAFVHAPAVTGPGNGATGQPLRPTVSVSAFSNAGPGDTGKSTQIQVATDVGFSSVVATHSGGYATSFTPGANLALNTLYYVRARHEGTTWGWSPWSAVTSFRTLAASLAAPQPSAPYHGAADVALVPTFSVQNPSVVGQAVTHIQVQISNNAVDVNIWDSGARAYGAVGGPGLAKGAWYCWRARLHGAVTGWTAWGPWTGFSTIAAAVGDVWNFTTVGAQNWTAPAPGTYKLECVGGGGYWATGQCRLDFYISNGGGGGYATISSWLAKGTSYSIVVGGSGTPGYGPIGNPGGTSSIGSTISASGGGGGSVIIRSAKGDCYSVENLVGIGGVGYGGSVNYSGGTGSSEFTYTPAVGFLGYGAGGYVRSRDDYNGTIAVWPQQGFCRITFMG